MFKVNVDGKLIEFSFDYFRGVNFEVKPNRVVTDVTRCKMKIGEDIYTGMACCVQGDIFRKETGRKNALTRALESAELPKNVRRLVWEEYHGRGV